MRQISGLGMAKCSHEELDVRVQVVTGRKEVDAIKTDQKCTNQNTEYMDMAFV